MESLGTLSLSRFDDGHTLTPRGSDVSGHGMTLLTLLNPPLRRVKSVMKRGQPFDQLGSSNPRDFELTEISCFKVPDNEPVHANILEHIEDLTCCKRKA